MQTVQTVVLLWCNEVTLLLELLESCSKHRLALLEFQELCGVIINDSVLNN